MSVEYWPWWLSGLMLAAIPVAHWLLVGRMMAVSGRFTALIDRWRFGPAEEPNLSEQEMIEALRALTLETMGPAAVAEPIAPTPDDAGKPKPRQTIGVHAAFLVSLFVGGLIAGLIRGAARPSLELRAERFGAIFGESAVVQALVLVAGGMLVGFGTRMAGGCTSGHGLCGASRLQKGSLLATLCFFASGVVTALALEALG